VAAATQSLRDKSIPHVCDLLSKLAALVAVIAALGFHCEPALAQSSPELRLCPPAIVNTCFIGYVTSASKMIVMLSSRDNDPLVGEEVEVDATPSGAVATTLDLSKQIDSVVMLDATGTDRITSAKLLWVADPLLTALYMSTFLQPPPDAATPQ
jgi:hypothetical protein